MGTIQPSADSRTPARFVVPYRPELLAVPTIWTSAIRVLQPTHPLRPAKSLRPETAASGRYSRQLSKQAAFGKAVIRELSVSLRMVIRSELFQPTFAVCLSTVGPCERRMNMHEKCFCFDPRQTQEREAYSAT